MASRTCSADEEVGPMRTPPENRAINVRDELASDSPHLLWESSSQPRVYRLGSELNTEVSSVVIVTDQIVRLTPQPGNNESPPTSL